MMHSAWLRVSAVYKRFLDNTNLPVVPMPRRLEYSFVDYQRVSHQRESESEKDNVLSSR